MESFSGGKKKHTSRPELSATPSGVVCNLNCVSDFTAYDLRRDQLGRYPSDDVTAPLILLVVMLLLPLLSSSMGKMRATLVISISLVNGSRDVSNLEVYVQKGYSYPFFMNFVYISP